MYQRLSASDELCMREIGLQIAYTMQNTCFIFMSLSLWLKGFAMTASHIFLQKV